MKKLSFIIRQRGGRWRRREKYKSGAVWISAIRKFFAIFFFFFTFKFESCFEIRAAEIFFYFRMRVKWILFPLFNVTF